MIKTNYGFKQNKICKQIMEGNEVVITQQLAWRLATGEVLGSNPSKGENLNYF